MLPCAAQLYLGQVMWAVDTDAVNVWRGVRCGGITRSSPVNCFINSCVCLVKYFFLNADLFLLLEYQRSWEFVMTNFSLRCLTLLNSSFESVVFKPQLPQISELRAGEKKSINFYLDSKPFSHLSCKQQG